MFWRTKGKRGFLKSIRVRLILGYTIVLSASILAVSIYFSFQMRARLLEMTKDYLVSKLGAAVDVLGDETGDGFAMSDFLSRHTRGVEGAHKIGYALFDDKGLVIARSEGFPEDRGSVTNLMDIPNKGERFAAGESEVRNADKTMTYLATCPFRDRAGNVFYLQFGVNPFGHREAFDVFLNTGLLMLPLILLVGLVSGVMLTRQFLSPIAGLIKASNKIVHSDATQELPVRGTGDELDKLALAFNSVLRELRGAYQRIIDFSANASHEIRLPITAIKGEAEVMLERGGDAGEYREAMEGIVIEMDRLTRIITRLLYLSRGDSGLDKLDMKKVELRGLLSKMTEFYRVLAEKKNISLSFLTQEGDFHVQADPSKLEEVFANLIENAIRYTPENGAVTLSITDKRSGCAVSVSDTGVGIPKGEQEKIFERFYRVDKTRSRDEGGAGLGLSIAAMIAKAHKGRIEVESIPQKGSTFTVSLPH